MSWNWKALRSWPRLHDVH